MSIIFSRSLASNFESWKERLHIKGLPPGVTAVGLMNQVMFRSNTSNNEIVEVHMSRTRSTSNMVKVAEIPASEYRRLSNVGNALGECVPNAVSLARYLVFKELGLLSAFVNNYQRA